MVGQDFLNWLIYLISWLNLTALHLWHPKYQNNFPFPLLPFGASVDLVFPCHLIDLPASTCPAQPLKICLIRSRMPWRSEMKPYKMTQYAKTPTIHTRAPMEGGVISFRNTPRCDFRGTPVHPNSWNPNSVVLSKNSSSCQDTEIYLFCKKMWIKLELPICPCP